VVGGQFLLDDLAKEKLRELIWTYAEFCGVEVISYCVLSNHFHVLVRVPESVSVSDRELVARMRLVYGKKSQLMQFVEEEYRRHGEVPSRVRESVLARMGDVSLFMKELKQRFTRWYNKQHKRYGTLWAERFKSVLVEDTVEAVSTVAMYIDLNPVRAGLVEDAKDYRFCGYAEAEAGHRMARRGIMSFHEGRTWRKVSGEYRRALFVESGRANHSGKVVLDREKIAENLENGGQLSRAEALRLRVRYLSDGLVLGSWNYVNEVFASHRDRFGPKRKTGARPLKALGGALGDLMAARDLRVSPVA